MSVVILVNAAKFKPCCTGLNSSFKIVCHPSVVDLHPLCPDGVIILLMYTQCSLSCSVYDVVFCFVCPGLYVVVCGVTVSCCVFCALLFYWAILFFVRLAFFIILFISLAITMSTCLLIMACSSSTVSFSASISCVCIGPAGSFPFRVCCFWTVCTACYFSLGPAYVAYFSGWRSLCRVVVVGGTFLIVAISTCRSIIAWTIFMGLVVSGSSSSK